MCQMLICKYEYKPLSFNLVQETYDYITKCLDDSLEAIAEAYVVYNDNTYDVIKFGRYVAHTPIDCITEKGLAPYVSESKQYSIFLLNKMLANKDNIKMLMVTNTRVDEFCFYCTDKKLVDVINKDPRHIANEYVGFNKDEVMYDNSKFIILIRSTFYKYIHGEKLD